LRRRWTFYVALLLIASSLLYLADRRVGILSFVAERVPYFQPSAGDYVNQGREAFRSGDLAKAVVDLQNALEKDPTAAEAYYMLALVFKSMGRFDEAAKAVEDLQRVVEDDLGSAEAHYVLALALESVGRFDEAVRAYQTSADLNPNLAAPHFNLAVIYKAEGKWDLQEAELKRAIELEPEFTGAHFLLADLYYAQNRLEEALAEFQRVIEIGAVGTAELVTAYLRSGDIYARLQDWERAREAWDAALRVDPGNEEAKERLEMYR